MTTVHATALLTPFVFCHFSYHFLTWNTLLLCEKGGMPPDMLKELMSNPELMELLQSVKMQDAMKLMMTGGQEVGT